ncbi:MAG: hypothetical protein DRH10_10345 [Deltaproteobacteria bacterium]|nr:MAG: hypothetical protein DRH10_10345 [Deltaproteobacteria bacterium]
MKMYSEDAIKEFHPRYTVEKCSRIAKRFRFKEMTDRFIEICYERKTEFGAFSGNFSINPLVLYELFPDKFYYLRDVNDYPEESSNGKGLSFLQCQASVYMEMFERLSIKLKEYELQYGKNNKQQIKSMLSEDYLNSLKRTNKGLYTHFTDNRINLTFIPGQQVPLIEVEDLIQKNRVKFPKPILFDITTNGYTSGNTEKESIIGGIFEIVERYTQTLFCFDEIQARKIDPVSIADTYPELKPIIEKCSDFFDEFAVVDISIVLNGVKFHSYITAMEKIEWGYRHFFAAGAHLDQRISLIRSLTECVQASKDPNTTDLAWKGNYFSKYFMDTISKRIKNLEEVELTKEDINCESIDQIYHQCLKAFKSVLIYDCTNEHFAIPVHIVYIPEVFSQSFIWPLLFSTGPAIKINKLECGENIEGLEKLVFTREEISPDEAEERNRQYWRLLKKLNDRKLIEYLISRETTKNNKNALDKMLEIMVPPTEITPLDSEDPDSFFYFYNKLNKKNKEAEDFEYLFKTYARIGTLDYALYFLRQNHINFNEKLDSYINKYNHLAIYRGTPV